MHMFVAPDVCGTSSREDQSALPYHRPTGSHKHTTGESVRATSKLMQMGLIRFKLGFIIPLGAQPQQCHDMITPNDMYSDLTCAFSGAFLITGGFAAILWGFLRSLSLHLQICWQVSLGKKFFWCSLFAGWGIPIVFSAVTLAVTSVSYRFGQTCYINHDKALQDYWGPLLAFAAVSTILQFVTFGYCVRVYIRSLFHGDSGSYHSTGLPSYNGSIKKVPAKVAYGRVRKVLALQWRGIMIVLIILTNVVFLAVVFIKSDNTEQAAVENLGRAEPWLLCLVLNPTDHSACLDKATSLVTKESIVMAAVILLSLNGIWALLFLGRMSMVHGWIDLLRGGFKRSHDFVSVDARRLSATPHNFEMVTRPAVYSFKETEPRITSISSDGETDTIMEMSPLGKKEFTSSEKGYVAPSLSFSSPRPPSAGRRLSNSSRAPSIGRIEGLPSRQASLVKPQGRDWDPSATHAKPLRNNSGFTRI